MTVPLRPGAERPSSIAPLRAKILASFVVALAILIVVGWLAMQNAAATLASAGSATHTFTVLGTLNEVFSGMTDAETASRGFALTGRDGFLEPYDSALAHVPTSLTRLRTLVDADSAQEARVDRLDSLVGAKFEIIELTIAARREGGLTAAARLVETERGKRAMDAIRQVTAEIGSRERAALERQADSLDTSGRRLQGAVLGGSLLAILVVGGAIIVILRDLAGRRQAEEALRRSEELMFQWVIGRGTPPPREP